jgi:hypothetical protein
MIITFIFMGCNEKNEPKSILEHEDDITNDSEIRFQDNFEGVFDPHDSNEIYDQWYRSGWNAGGYVKTSSDIEAREGSKSAEVKLVANENGRSRSEIGVNLRNSLGHYWVGFSVYIPSDIDISRLVLDRDKFVFVLAQWGVWKNNPGVPDFAIRMGREDGVNKFFLTYEPLPEPNVIYLWDGPLIQGEWVDWVVHINWAKNDTGIFEVWQNGEKVFSKTDFQSTDGEGIDVKSKIGLYYSSWGNRPRDYDEIKIYYDDYTIAKGEDMYDEVKPGN